MVVYVFVPTKYNMPDSAETETESMPTSSASASTSVEDLFLVTHSFSDSIDLVSYTDY